VNPAMIPRSPACRVCREVSTSEDVDGRLWDTEGNPRSSTREARDYLVARMNWSANVASNALGRHMTHIEAYLANPHPGAPINRVERIVSPDVTFSDVFQLGMNVGVDAIRGLAARLQAGELTAREEIQLAKLAIASAGGQANAVARGRNLPQFEKLLSLASGLEG
jgi:hypothetical protein